MRKKTNSEFLKEVNELVGNEFTFLEEYVNSRTPILVKHNKCGNEFKVRPNDFLRSTPCRYCNGNISKKKTTAEFKHEMYQLVGNSYTLLSSYIARNQYVTMRCNTCGNVFKVTPGNFLCGTRCVICHINSLRLSKEVVTKRIIDCLGPDYSLVSDYVSSQKKSILYHKECNTYFKVRLDDVFTKHSGCPLCNSSRGEHYIYCYLKSNNINFETQKTFPELVDTNRLSYDFYLSDYKLLIEYQGEQHYIPKNFGGISKEEALSRFELQKYHDKLKRDFAKEKGLTLLEISYKYDSYTAVCCELSKKL